MTETTYFSDPDGNGIELTFETPERGEFIVLPDGMPAARTPDGQLHSAREPLDLRRLLTELDEPEPGVAPATGVRVGHVHLHVGDVQRAATFYRDLLGFRPLMDLPALAMADFTVDHHVPHVVAINAWSGAGAEPAPSGTAGLRRFTIELPTGADVRELTDRLRSHGWPLQEIPGGIRLADPSSNPIHVLERQLVGQ